MSLAEIKREMQSLTQEERAQLRAYSKLLDLKENPARQAELFAALDNALAGNIVNEEEFRKLLGERPKPAA